MPGFDFEPFLALSTTLWEVVATVHLGAWALVVPPPAGFPPGLPVAPPFPPAWLMPPPCTILELKRGLHIGHSCRYWRRIFSAGGTICTRGRPVFRSPIESRAPGVIGCAMGCDDPGNTQADAVLGNLPVPLTRLVGRDEALGELRSLVWRTRVLTLCGPGGAGKTRLATGLAEAVRPDFVAGAWWVDLSTTPDGGLVARTVATTLHPDEPTVEPTPAAVARRFPESTLLVLDNCEHIVDGCADFVVQLLERAPAVRVLTTSRRPLGIPGEHVWRVPGLAVDGEEAAEAGAVELFIERAAAASGSFALEDPDTLAAAARICRCLDGMPLAIELAAARVPVLGTLQIAERLAHESSFLRQSNRTAPARHQTLRAMLEWSHRLLEPAEQQLFRRLAAFRGSFSLDAAEAVGASNPSERGDVLDLLGVLVDRSLVHVVDSPGPPRYRLLVTVRQYASELLETSGEAPATRERHARFYRALADAAAARPDDDGQRAVLELEHDNLSRALRWWLEESPADAVELASVLWPFWYRRGYYEEARRCLDQALDDRAAIPAPTAAQALIRAGEVAFLQCDYGVAITRLESALGLTESLGDRRASATALQRLGGIAREQGRYDEARALHGQSLEVWRDLGDAHNIASSQDYLGFVAWLAGDCDDAEGLCGTALAEFQAAGDFQDAASALVNLGAAALYRGDAALAAERLEEALSIARRLDFQEGLAWAMHELAIAGRRRRRPTHENAGLLHSALLIHRRLGDRWRLASVLEELVAAWLCREDPRLAVEALAAVDRLRATLGTPVPPAEAPDRDATLGRLRSKLSATAFAAAWADGRVADLERMIDRVLAALEGTGGAVPTPAESGPAPILTRRELAVLELLSEGQTNREIAAALYISPSTAGVHVSNVLRKLGAKRRVDAAAQAHRLGLVRREEPSRPVT